MANLTGKSIAATYTTLLKFIDNSTVETTVKNITDGAGNSSALNLGTTSVLISGSLLLGGNVIGSGSIQLIPTDGDARSIVIQNTTPSDIHIKTTDAEAYDLFIGDDTKYVKLDKDGSIYINSYDYVGPNSYQWVFRNDGATLLPDSLSMYGTLNVQDDTTLEANVTLPAVLAANYPDDSAAAAGGIPVGGLYRNGNVVSIRIV